MTDDQDPNPVQPNYVLILVTILSACISTLLIVATYVLARWMLGLV